MKGRFRQDLLDEVDALVSTIGEEYVTIEEGNKELQGTISVVLDPSPKPILFSAKEGKDYRQFETVQLPPLKFTFSLPADYPCEKPKIDVESIWMTTIMNLLGLEILKLVREESEKAEMNAFLAQCHDCEVCFENKAGRHCVRFFPFCTACHRGYHGLHPCAWGTREVTLSQYLQASPEDRMKMALYYGGIENLEAEMEKAFEEADGRSYTWIEENSKRCPQCGIPVQKHNGCNLVVCIMCDTPFCWSCEENLEETYFTHFSESPYCRATGPQIPPEDE
nr:RWD and Zinc finger domain containing protein [Haemonchus contortus]